ncbi:hypothetical protein D3C71_1475760 [compost metagenome]
MRAAAESRSKGWVDTSGALPTGKVPGPIRSPKMSSVAVAATGSGSAAAMTAAVAASARKR